MANIYVRSTDGNDADNGSTWALAKATLTGALAIATNADTIWVSQAHAESTAAQVTLTCPTTPGLKIYCGDDSAEPPTALATTATVAVGASASPLEIRGCAVWYGVGMLGGTSASANCDIFIGVGTQIQVLEFIACPLKLRANAAAEIAVGPGQSSSTQASSIKFRDCQVTFGNTGSLISLNTNNIDFVGLTLDAAGSIPTTLFKGYGPGVVTVAASDLSGRAWTNLINVASMESQTVRFHACKLPASWTTVTGSFGVAPGSVTLVDCHSGDTHGYFEYHTYQGNILRNTSVYYTGGASGSVSWQVNTSSAASFTNPFLTPWIDFYNDATSAVSPWIEVLRNNDSTTAWNDNQIWIEVQDKVSSGFTNATQTDDRCGLIATAAAQDTGAGTGSWTGETGSCWSGKLVAPSRTPAEAGYRRARVAFGVASSSSLYIDPQIRT